MRAAGIPNFFLLLITLPTLMATCSQQEASGVQKGEGNENDEKEKSASFDSTELSGTDWQIRSMKTDTGGMKELEESYVLSFEDASSYRLRLKVNTCHGEYEITGKEEIQLHRAACTEKCCDPERAKELANSLHRAVAYGSKGDELLLKGEELRIRGVRDQEREGDY